jgi:hypothetical protein
MSHTTAATNHHDLEKGGRLANHNPNGVNDGMNVATDPILDQAPPPFLRRGRPTRLGNPGPLYVALRSPS